MLCCAVLSCCSAQDMPERTCKKVAKSVHVSCVSVYLSLYQVCYMIVTGTTTLS
jgi:hypothetical protein